MRRECDLSDPVSKWLTDQGYAVYAEVFCLGAQMDLVGVSTEAVVSVELKLCLSRTVIRQAALNQVKTNRAYVAVASRPRNKSVGQCIEFGIGVLLVASDVIVRAEPRPEAFTANHLVVTRLREYLSGIEPGGVGGLTSRACEQQNGATT